MACYTNASPASGWRQILKNPDETPVQVLQTSRGKPEKKKNVRGLVNLVDEI
jgi:hypothetical protein